MNDVWTLDLDGWVRLTDAAGEERTPRGAMLRALLVLLAEAPQMRVSRRAVQLLLWSTREKAQAEGSLRRAIADLRRAIGGDSELVVATRDWVGLDPLKIRLVRPDPGAEDRFAADLEIGDPAFRAWLSQRRTRTEQYASSSAEPLIRIVMPPVRDPQHDVGDLIVEIAVSLVRIYCQVEVTIGTRDRVAGRLYPSCARRVLSPDTVLLVAGITDGDGAQIWSRSATAASGEVGLAAVHIAGAMAAAMMPGPLDVVRGITSFDHDRDVALAALRTGGLMFKPDVAAALTAFGLMAKRLDRMVGAEAEREFTSILSGLARDNTDDIVAQAVCALGAVKFGERIGAEHLVPRVRSMDSQSAFVRYAAAQIEAAQHDPEIAMRHATAIQRNTFQDLAAPSAAAAMLMGQLEAGAEDKALRWARREWQLAPQSRPALRFLAALSYRAGDEKTAAMALSELEKLEPGFSAAQMAEKNYPVHTLRRLDMLDIARARHLGGRSPRMSALKKGGGRSVAPRPK